MCHKQAQSTFVGSLSSFEGKRRIQSAVFERKVCHSSCNCCTLARYGLWIFSRREQLIDRILSPTVFISG